MIDISTLERFDKQKMFEIYDNWPKIALLSFETVIQQIDFENIEHIVFAGMGGSGAIGDMFASILSKTNIHVDVVKGYVLPKTVDSNTLVIVISVSGNTVETLSILNSAHKLGCKIIAFSSGGQIKDFCAKNKVEYRFVEQYNSPRASFASYLYTILKVLHKTLKIKESDIKESIYRLDEIGNKINSLNLSEDNPALNLAKWITKNPITYYPFGLQAAAIRFKNSLQENTKLHSSAEDIIEFCHNGIVAWEKTSQYQPILLQGVDDYIKTKERWRVIEEFFSENQIEYWKINSVSGSILSKIISLIYELDYATIYKSVILEIDPSPVRSIDYIKKRISNV